MLQKDFILKQINDFFETISKIMLNIETNRLDEAEATLKQHLNETLIEEFTKGKVSVNFNVIKFQVQLLFLKYKIDKQKNIHNKELKQQCINLLSHAINLHSNEYDMQLNEMLNMLKD
ncbi:MAG: hypothetical protein QM763_08405 [Agriterribacter sp.]